jgi:steroid delta-isomerase-like uncharacterized protein
MTEQDNKRLISSFYGEVVAKGNLARLCEFISADYLDHTLGPALRGPEVARSHLEAVRATFPDFTLTIEDMIAENDKVVTRVIGQGTHRGMFLGIPPSGVVVQVKGINIDRIAGRRIVEHWGEADTLGMLRQMGLDPYANQRLETST